MKHIAHRIDSGHYIYRGYHVICVGYYEPEHHICWEAIDEKGCGFAHAYTLREVKMNIDEEINGNKNS